MLNNTTLLKAAAAGLVMAGAMLCASPAAQAQSMVGEWVQFPVYSGAPDRVMATTDGGMFYLVGEHLYSMNDGVFTDMARKLHSTSVTAVYYSPEGKFLAVGFNDGNIDIIRDGQDTAINFSDIKDAAMNASKRVNDFEFYNGRLYVATNFGLVVYDLNKGVVLQSGVYNTAISQVATIGSHVMLVENATYHFAPLNSMLNRLENFSSTAGEAVNEIRRLGDDKAILVKTSGVGTLVWDSQAGTAVAGTSWSDVTNVPYLMAATDGSYYAVSNNVLSQFSTDAQRTLSLTLPTPLQGNSLGICRGLDTVWAGDASGMGLFAVSDDGQSLTTLSEKSIAPGTMAVEKVEYMSVSPDGKRIYFTNCGSSRLGVNSSALQKTDYYCDGVFTPVEPTDGKGLKSPGPVAEDPDDPSVTWVASRNGVYVVKDRQVIAVYTAKNAPFYSIPQVYGIKIDHEGNLWITTVHHQDEEHTSGLKMLPSASRKKYTDIAKEEWHVYSDLKYFSGLWHGTINPCKQSNMVVATGFGEGGLGIINTNGTLGNPDDDTAYSYHPNYVDTDGKTFDPGLLCGSVEDLNGRVWVVGTAGIFYIANNDAAIQGTIEVGRPKVPRNDGTNYADYLLEGVTILDIAVDGLNRKWIATENGVYCVNEDGSEILEHYNMDNSILTTNNIRAIYADPVTNMVYVGTQNGSFAYASTSVPGSADYSNVYAYPNPVKPGFSGWITITGLMDGSLVKIADMSGNTIHSGRSEGGMYVWDGCDRNGSRVRSGVYLVFASQNLEGTSAVVTKILVMN